MISWLLVNHHVQRRVWAAGFLFLVCLLVLPACEKKNKGEKGEETEEVAIVPVEVTRIGVGDVSDTIFATAKVASKHQLTLTPEAAGTLSQLSISEGDTVVAGQFIAKISNSDIKLAVSQAQSRLKRAQREVDRLKPLLAKGFIAKTEFDRAEAERDLARDDVKRAKNGAADTTIEAPFNAVVVAALIEVGAVVSPATPIATLVDVEALEVQVQLPEKSLGRIQVGQPARIASPAFDGEGFPGHVERIAPIVDPVTATIEVIIALDQVELSSGAKLRPGMFAEVDIITATRTKVALVPKRAIQYEETKAFVFVVKDAEGTDAPQEAERRWIELGVSEGEMTEIVSGVSPGENVIVLGQAGLKTGAPIEVVTKKSEAKKTKPQTEPKKTEAKGEKDTAPAAGSAPTRTPEGGTAPPPPASKEDRVEK